MGDTAPRRLQRFAGFVQSNRPLPPFRVLLDGVEQAIESWNLGDPNAPPGLRYTGYFTFHREIAAWGTCLALDIRSEGRTIAHRTFARERPDDRTHRPLLLFMHIPKTAGTSLRLALELQPDVRMLRLYDNRAFLSFDACARATPTAFDDLDVVFGHFKYGLHALTHRACRYVTVLRHPADLMRSTYLFHKYVVGTDAFARSERIEDALAASGYGNILTRLISGKASPAPVDADDLAKALAVVDAHFDYIGTVEDLDATRRVLGDAVLVQLAPFEINVTPPTPETHADTRDALIARCGRFMEYDLRLYDYAVGRFASGACP